jgi:iron complex transport system permease protein
VTTETAPQRERARESRHRPRVRVRASALVVGGLGCALAVGIVLSAGIGPVTLPMTTTGRILWAHLVPGEHVATWTPTQDQIVWHFRLPRTLLAALAGCALAVAGTVLQAVIRNRPR